MCLSWNPVAVQFVFALFVSFHPMVLALEEVHPTYRKNSTFRRISWHPDSIPTSYGEADSPIANKAERNYLESNRIRSPKTKACSSWGHEESEPAKAVVQQLVFFCRFPNVSNVFNNVTPELPLSTRWRVFQWISQDETVLDWQNRASICGLPWMRVKLETGVFDVGTNIQAWTSVIYDR